MVDTVNADLSRPPRGEDRPSLEAARTEVTLTVATRTGIRARIREVKAVQAEAGDGRGARPAGGCSLATVAGRDAGAGWPRCDGTDIPLVVLDAYMKAAQIAALVTPECGIPWWALAGIGRTESHHGTAGGARGAGRRQPHQSRSSASRSTARARPRSIDARRTAAPDRAQGPMQFITATWERWGARRQRRRLRRGPEHLRRRGGGRRVPVRERADAHRRRPPARLLQLQPLRAVRGGRARAGPRATRPRVELPAPD